MVLSAGVPVKYSLSSVFTKKHFTDRRFCPPDAAFVPEIHTLKTRVWGEKGVYQTVNLLLRGHEDINDYIGEKSGDPFAAATCTTAVLVTLVSADF
jgi:hypothetical protein